MKKAYTNLLETIIKENDLDKFKSFLLQNNVLNYNPLHFSVKYNRIEMVKFLINDFKIRTDICNAKGNTSLHIACDEVVPNLEIIKFLLENHADVNKKNIENVTPFMKACKHGKMSLITLLIEHGANINLRDDYDRTPLIYSIKYNHAELVEFLLKNNASTYIEDCDNYNPLLFSIWKAPNLSKLIIPFSKNYKNFNDNTLIAAVFTNNYEIVVDLLQNGAQVQKIVNENSTLGVGIIKGHFDVFKLIWNNITHEFLMIEDLIFLISEIFFPREEWVIYNSEFLKLIINTTDFNYKYSEGISGILAKMLQYYDSYSQSIHFYNNNLTIFTEESLVLFFTFFVSHNFVLNDKDLIAFLLYFKNCPYRLKLLQILFSKNTFLTTDVLIKDYRNREENLQIISLILQNITIFDPKPVYRKLIHIKFFLPPNQGQFLYKHETLIFFLERFTPSHDNLHYLFHVYSNLKNEINFNGTVKSLLEMSRDATRLLINNYIKNCNELVLFTEIVQNLDIPKILKDVILYKIPVNTIYYK